MTTHDTDPPPPPSEPTVADAEPIPAGKAHLAIAGAFVDLLAAVARAEAVAAAVARALDATPSPKSPLGG